MKQKVNTILRKGLDQFERQSSGSKGRFKLDIQFFKHFFVKVIHNSMKHCLKLTLKINTWKCINRLLYRFIYNLSRQNMKNKDQT